MHANNDLSSRRAASGAFAMVVEVVCTVEANASGKTVSELFWIISPTEWLATDDVFPAELACSANNIWLAGSSSLDDVTGFCSCGRRKIVSSHPLSCKSIILIAFYPAPKEIKFSINSLKGASKMGKKIIWFVIEDNKGAFKFWC
jgi:hypothetical protein